MAEEQPKTPFEWLNRKMHEWTPAQLRTALHMLGAQVSQTLIWTTFQQDIEADGLVAVKRMILVPIMEG